MSRAEFTLPEGFTTEVRAEPGFDHRDEPDDNRGASSLTLWFILRGPGGAIAWELITGIMARPIADPGWSIYAKRPPERGIYPGTDWTGGLPHQPTAGPVSLHWLTPDKDWWSGSNVCDILPGRECWQNVGYLVGDQVMAALVADGDPGVWRQLFDIYRDWTAPDVEATNG